MHYPKDQVLITDMWKVMCEINNVSRRFSSDSTPRIFRSFKRKNKNLILGTSLMAQWLRICLPVQRTWVPSLVREDSTCHGATKPMCHNYWACALEPTSHNYWARVPKLLKPAHLEPVLCSKRSHRNEKPTHCNEE